MRWRDASSQDPQQTSQCSPLMQEVATKGSAGYDVGTLSTSMGVASVTIPLLCRLVEMYLFEQRVQK